MKYRRLTASLLALFFVASAQAQKQTIAIVNNQELTVTDLDANARQAVEELNAKLAQIRRDVLTAEITSLLLDLEASQRKLIADQLYDLEIASRVTAPTDAQIDAEYRNNRKQYGDYELWLVRDGIEGKLRDEQEKKLLQDWTTKHQDRVRSVKTVDINDPKLKPGTVLATVGQHKVTLDSLSERLKPRIFEACRQAYETERAALDKAIDNLLLNTEAKAKSLKPDDIVRAEITDKMREPTEDEIKKYYQTFSWQFNDLASARTKIVAQLKKQEQERLEKALNDCLRAGASVRIMITELESPTQNIGTNGSPSHGNTAAPVTVVEFGDFQCYACGQMHPIVEQALKAYGDQVRYVFRQYPLSMHRRARMASEAALAAHAQGRFWEYSTVLFKNQGALDVPSLKKYALEVGLDGPRFNKAIDERQFAAEVRRDMREGEIHGVDIVGTPTYFINGKRLPVKSYNLEGFKKAIDEVLATSNHAKKQ
ncbi:MAG TPA: thioredoxin domain-containing protein [Pyrinomonadaceae bacterium]|nr:thioredoxin domain-containing protein [Pyrinomonadaceae bacterium]